MTTPDKTALLALLDRVRMELETEPQTPVAIQALHQCERLRQALLQFHAEGLRFASFTLSRLMQQPGTNFRDTTQRSGRQLAEALSAAGYLPPH